MERRNLMEEEQQAVEETVEKAPEDGIVVHNLESDMRDLGIVGDKPSGTTEEAEPEEADPKVESEKPEEKPKKTRAQRRIERLARDKKRIEEENQRLKEQLESAKKVESNTADSTEVNLDDYDSYDEYLEAVKAAEAKTSAAVVEDVNVPSIPKIDPVALDDIFEDGSEEYKDFETKVRDKDLNLPADVLAEAMESDSAVDILYHIATHPDDADRLAELKGKKLAKEIAKLEVILTKEKDKGAEVPVKSNAPKPISPVQGGSVKGLSLDDDNLSFEQHEALLRKATTQSTGGFI